MHLHGTFAGVPAVTGWPMYAMKGSMNSTGFPAKIPVKFYGQESIKCIDKVCAYVSTRGPQALSANHYNTTNCFATLRNPNICLNTL